MDKDRVAPALGQITSGLFIATATVDEEPIGMLCSFVEQASFHPPMVTMALTPDRRLVEAFTFGNCKQVGLNILSTNNQNLIGPFANPNNEDPFEDVLLVENSHQLPQLERALAFLVCEYRQEMIAGDHHVYLFEVLDGELIDADAEPIMRVRRNGFTY
ncbi:flavin reductase family protein [bacterium]|jgi:flavin reductase (DIM6/NTAB) family NADH-FMN oxidoreductase RutF|nr:flavin reductase family protein [bacterium]MDF1788893.1 flavin reductase family protein [Verrucomicrobiales bacterium]